jgi:hypothetical protein
VGSAVVDLPPATAEESCPGSLLFLSAAILGLPCVAESGGARVLGMPEGGGGGGGGGGGAADTFGLLSVALLGLLESMLTTEFLGLLRGWCSPLFPAGPPLIATGVGDDSRMITTSPFMLCIPMRPSLIWLLQSH